MTVTPAQQVDINTLTPQPPHTDLPACPVELTLTLISTRWRVLILRDLMNGPKRFSELRKSITGISQKSLTTNLRAMEEAALLTRTVYPEVPPKVVYELTDLGYSLFPVLNAMDEWGSAYRAHIAPPETP